MEAPCSLLRVERIFTPEPSDATDILMCGERIAWVGKRLDPPAGWPVELVEVPGALAVPGFIDGHVHVTGGGGEGGYATRCPEISVDEIVAAGVTTVVGCLGTDDVTRHPEALLAKVRALEEQGVSAYMYVGSYAVPPVTLTGSVKRDLVLIDKVIGVGEIAISDHRSAQPQPAELRRLAAEARVGGMLAGKAGIVHVHVGSGRDGLKPLFDIVEQTELPITQFVPTHVNRTRRLLDEAERFASLGGTVDVTAFDFPSADAVPAWQAIVQLAGRGVEWSRITMSSDSNGSLPEFDESGRLVRMRVASIRSLLADWRSLVRQARVPLERALQVVTSNVASVLKLQRKGRLLPGMDADIAVFDGDLNVLQVWCRGRRLHPPGA
ncbi:MAG: beta-aspartyl-peptidase [Bacillota bacterium]